MAFAIHIVPNHNNTKGSQSNIQINLKINFLNNNTADSMLFSVSVLATFVSD
jgi:hypothetical protein